MIYDADKEFYTLSTGKEFGANCGIIGLSTTFELGEGYDGRIYLDFTPEEKKEISDYMIALWKEWVTHD